MAKLLDVLKKEPAAAIGLLRAVLLFAIALGVKADGAFASAIALVSLLLSVWTRSQVTANTTVDAKVSAGVEAGVIAGIASVHPRPITDDELEADRVQTLPAPPKEPTP